MSICDGWTDVVRDVPIQPTYLLYFQPEDELTFRLDVYNANGCCIKMLLPEVKIEPDQSDEEDFMEIDGLDTQNPVPKPIPVQAPPHPQYDKVVVARQKFTLSFEAVIIIMLLAYYGNSILNQLDNSQHHPIYIAGFIPHSSHLHTIPSVYNFTVLISKLIFSMAGQTFNLIRDLNVRREHFVLKVRVINVWRWNEWNNKTKPFSLEMIMIDEEGDRIQSNCLVKWWSRFEDFFKDGEVLIISKPTLGENKGKFKFIDNPIKVGMNFKTEIQRSDTWNGPLNRFVFADFQKIVALEVEKTVSIDIIGMIIDSNPPETYAINDDGSPKIRINFELEDAKGCKIWITLFQEYAERLIDYIKSQPDGTEVVIIVQFAMFSVYRNRHSVSNYFEQSKLFINGDFDEFSAFKRSYNENQGDVRSSKVSRLSSRVSYSLEKDFLIDTEFNQIAELNVINKVKKVVILGTFKCLMEGTEWWYRSCKLCNKAIERFLKADATITSDDMWYYEHKVEGKCDNSKIEPTIKFMMLIKVQDGTGSVILTLFDKEVRRLLKVTAAELVARIVEQGKPPVEFESLFGKRLAMKIDISSFNIQHEYRYFTIEKLTDKESIISALDEKHNKDQSINFSSQVCGSIETDVSKDCLGVSTTQVTPDSVNMAQKVLDCQTEADGLKRNLSEVYDGDDLSITSSSKTRSAEKGKCTMSGCD
ncbi:hypothetical protein SSX86_022515 [Deinandra increscens subsp. villosa]|uniref:Replication protein A1 n=1 Tax=Deinandra increscens subsp. villosa TaxID=3103831 RepID=A0AAP0CIZ9_9ASTR